MRTLLLRYIMRKILKNINNKWGFKHYVAKLHCVARVQRLKNKRVVIENSEYNLKNI